MIHVPVSNNYIMLSTTRTVFVLAHILVCTLNYLHILVELTLSISKLLVFRACVTYFSYCVSFTGLEISLWM